MHSLSLPFPASVNSIEFERESSLSARATCTGFDGLTLGCLRFDTLDELNEAGLPPSIIDPLTRQLNDLATLEANQWAAQRSELRAWLGRQ